MVVFERDYPRHGLPYRLDIHIVYELLNRTISRTVQVTAASGLAQEFLTVIPQNNKNKE